MSGMLDELISAALLGTERRAPTVPGSSGLLGEVLERLPWDSDAPAALLEGSALVTVHARAGRIPPTLDGALAEPAVDESRSVCSDGAASLLGQLIAEHGAHRHGGLLLVAWLERVVARRELAPPAMLPDLLELPMLGMPERYLVQHLGGERLAWLARQRPEWSWASAAPGEAGEAEWELAPLETRLQILFAARRDDPDRGRQLVERTWAGDPPDQRAKFLGLLAEGLGPFDEPLLELASGDRRRDVRQAAMDLLASLSGSAYQERMWARVEPLIQVSGRRKLEVALLPEADAWPGRDTASILADVGVSGGPRAALLAETVAATDLAAWSRKLGQDPRSILASAAGAENADALFIGWRAAARRQRSPEWVGAVALELNDFEALAAVPVVAVEDAVLTLLRGISDPDLRLMLQTLHGSWPQRLSSELVKVLHASVAKHPRSLDLVAEKLAHSIHQAVIAEARSAFAEMESSNRLMHLLDLREALIRELPTP